MEITSQLKALGTDIKKKRVAINDHAMTGVAAIFFLMLTFIFYVWNFDEIREQNRKPPSPETNHVLIPLRYATDNTFLNFAHTTPSETIQREQALIFFFRKIDILSSAGLFRTQVDKITLASDNNKKTNTGKKEKPFAFKYEIRGDDQDMTDIVFSIEAQSLNQVENWRGVVRSMEFFCTDNILVNLNQVGLKFVAKLAYTLDNGIGFEDPLRDVECEFTHFPDRTITIKLLKGGVEIPYNVNSMVMELVNADVSRFTPVPNYDVSFQQNITLSEAFKETKPREPEDFTKIRSLVCLKENKMRMVLHPLRMLSYLYKRPISSYIAEGVPPIHINELECEDLSVWLTVNDSVLPVKRIVFATDQPAQLDVFSPEGTLLGITFLVNGPNPFTKDSEKATENTDFEIYFDDRDFWEFTDVEASTRENMEFNTRLNLYFGAKPETQTFQPTPTNPHTIAEFTPIETSDGTYSFAPRSLKEEIIKRGPSTTVLDVVAPPAKMKQWGVEDTRELQILGACVVVLMAMGYYVRIYNYAVRLIPFVGVILSIAAMVAGLVEYFRAADIEKRIKTVFKYIYGGFITVVFVLFCMNFLNSRGLPFGVMLNILTFVACFNILVIVETDAGRNNKMYAYAFFTIAFVCLSLSIAYHNQGIHEKIEGKHNLFDSGMMRQSIKLFAGIGIFAWVFIKYVTPNVYPFNQTTHDNEPQKLKYAVAMMFLFAYYILLPKIYAWRLNLTRRSPEFQPVREHEAITRLPEPTAKIYKTMFLLIFYLIYFFVYLFSVELTQIIFYDNESIQDAKRVRTNFETAPHLADGYYVKERIYENNLDVYQSPTISLVMVLFIYTALLLVGLYGYVAQRLSYFNFVYSCIFISGIIYVFVYTKNSDQTQKMVDLGRYLNSVMKTLIVNTTNIEK